VKGAIVTVLGLSFKEDCPDLRNSRVIDLIRELEGFGVAVQVHDPRVDPEEARREYDVTLAPLEALRLPAAVVLAVAHREYRELGLGGLGAPSSGKSRS